MLFKAIIYKHATDLDIMKIVMRFLFFVPLFAIFSAFFAFAQTACINSDDTIFRISSTTNAHGETWGSNNYNYPVCYSTIFGHQYSGANPHNCVVNSPGSDPQNLVLRLSSNTNAHAQTPDYSGSAYPVDVCYGDLSCYSTSNSCGNGEVEVVSLSNNDNSHIELANSNNYNLKICCIGSVSGNPRIFNPQWTYYDGSAISSGSSVCSGSYLVASVKTSGISDGDNVSINVYDRDLISNDEIIKFLAPVRNNEAKVSIDLSNNGMRNLFASFLGGSEGNELELYFTANKSNLPIIQSGQVIYYDNSSICSYSDPVIAVAAPIHKGIYFRDTEINFTSQCSSQIGPLRTEWTIKQGSQIYTNNNASFNLVFGRDFGGAGQVNIRLKCTDISGNYGFDEKQMLVVASPFALAYINQPELDDFVYHSPQQSEPYFPQTVPFSSSDSFVIDVVNSCNDVRCLGGDCPSQTQNSPLSCGTFGAPVTISSSGSLDYSSLNFDWTFWDNNWNNNWSSYEGSGAYRGTVVYDDVSNSLNDKHMSVSITHPVSGATANFQRDFTIGRCLNNGNNYYSSKYTSLSTSLENNACTGGDTIPGTADDCCPIGFQCSNSGSQNGQNYCQRSSNQINRCEEFTSMNSCNSNNDTSIPLASYGRNPPICTFLKCYWNSTAGCGVRATNYGSNSTGCNTGGSAGPRDDCAWTTNESECVNGRKTLTYNTILGSASCNKDPLVVPCGSLSFELSFFGLREFIISIILIASIYFIKIFKKND